MNFFKAVFSDDPDSPTSGSESPEHDPHSPEKQQLPVSEPPHADESPRSPRANPDSNPNPTSRWNIGGLLKTLTIKSESVIETYKRDLEEFSSGLRKEIEVAQGSLGTVGATIDELGSTVLKGTAQIISQGKEALLSVDLSSDTSSEVKNQAGDGSSPQVYGRYSRFEAQVRAIQVDVSTFCDEPEDDDYSSWKIKFDLGKKEEEIKALFDENGAMKSVYEKIVPNDVDHGTFWCRYFYRVHKLELAENFRAKLVKRAISSEEEELSWDVYDEDEDDKAAMSKESRVNKPAETEGENSEQVRVSGEEKSAKMEETGKEEAIEKAISVPKEEQIENKSMEGNATEVKSGGNVASVPENKDVTSGKEELAAESEKNVASVPGVEPEKSDKDHVLSKAAPQEEEDLGWDEIEDLSSIDGHKVSHGEAPSSDRAELRKRLSAAGEEEDEDLSWDIEDDDEPAAATGRT